MDIIDVHCHLDLKQFEYDLQAVIARIDSSMFSAIQNSLNPGSIRRSIEIAKKSEKIMLALGLYPVDALKLSDGQIDSEIDFIKKEIKSNPKVIAIGEVGLDYHWVKDKKEQAREKVIFGRFIELAEHSKLPLIVHSRESEQDAFDMIQSSSAKAVFHCFNGSIGLAKKSEEAGYFFSIPASITFIKAFQELAKEISINQIFCETDSPYMSPFRGKRNEPAFVIESYKKIAAIKNKKVEEIAENIQKNYGYLFKQA